MIMQQLRRAGCRNLGGQQIRGYDAATLGVVHQTWGRVRGTLLLRVPFVVTRSGGV